MSISSFIKSTGFVDWFIQPRDSSLTSLQLHVYGAESLNVQAEITDNFVESNVARQDHIALKPIVFTVSGEVGELTWFKNEKENSLMGAVPQKLQPVVAFLPTFSKQAQYIQDKALKVIDLIDSIDNAATRYANMFFSDGTVGTAQHKSFNYLINLWSSRTPINIKTPWTKLQGFVIQNIEFTQPDRTVDKTQVKISLKEFKTVDDEKTDLFDKETYMLRASSQRAGLLTGGATTGIELGDSDFKPQQWPLSEE